MRMTELIIGEHYAWQGKRVKLVATGVVLEHYQHRGVQIETPGKGGSKRIEARPAREITSTWEDFEQASAKWAHEKQLQRKEKRGAENVSEYLRHALQSCDICATVSTYPGHIFVTFDDYAQAQLLADILADQ